MSCVETRTCVCNPSVCTTPETPSHRSRGYCLSSPSTLLPRSTWRDARADNPYLTRHADSSSVQWGALAIAIESQRASKEPSAWTVGTRIITTPDLEENRRVSRFLRSVEISGYLSVAKVWFIVLKKLWFPGIQSSSRLYSQSDFSPFVDFCARSSNLVIAGAVNFILHLWTASLLLRHRKW